MEEIDVTGKTVMVIGAHPDDIEIIGGGTLAKTKALGGKGVVVIVTNGDKGSEFGDYTHDELVKIREIEQTKACEILGTEQVEFLRFPDCYTKPDLQLKERIVYMIRKYRPDIVITHHIRILRGTFVNHKDHRSTAEAVIDAYFPLAGNSMCFCEHFEDELKPHNPKTLLMLTMNPEEANAFVDTSGYLEKKLDALRVHSSQLQGKGEPFVNMMALLSKNAGSFLGKVTAETFICIQMDRSKNIDKLLQVSTIKLKD